MRPSLKSPTLSVSSITSVGLSTSTLSPGLSPRRSRFGISPPPSPGLPSLIPRHGKKPPKESHRQLKRLVLATCGLGFLIWIGLVRLSSSNHYSPFSHEPEYELVGGDTLPDEPSAIVVLNEKGKTRWTVSIPSNSSFPLRPAQYKEICSQTEDIAEELQLMNSKKRKRKERGYYYKDPYFVDITEAQRKGLLPKDEEQWYDERYEGLPMCQKSLTYVMETSDAGMGNTLLGMWLAYGLATKEGRAFFVDDTRWPYGDYLTYFTPPPSPSCAPAPPSHRLPCPHNARHLVVSAAIFPHAFGPKFQLEYLDPHKAPKKEHHKIFALMRLGHDALFHLADPGDSNYVSNRVTTLFSKAHRGGGMNVGLHVRRGDVRPWDYMYKEDYIPLTTYMDDVRQILIDRYENDHDDDDKARSSSTTDEEIGSVLQLAENPVETDPASSMRLVPRHGAPGFMASQLFLASDDPDIYAAPEVSRAQRAQDRIILASKSLLEAQSGGPVGGNGWIDEVHGWEGGFYASQFWGLGMPEGNIINNDEERMEEEDNRNEAIEEGNGIPPEALAMREVVARAYLLDLAVLGQSDAVVCAVSSAACRVLGVMLGWEKAVQKGLWVNVDGGYGWQGLVFDEDG